MANLDFFRPVADHGHLEFVQQPFLFGRLPALGGRLDLDFQVSSTFGEIAGALPALGGTLEGEIDWNVRGRGPWGRVTALTAPATLAPAGRRLPTQQPAMLPVGRQIVTGLPDRCEVRIGLSSAVPASTPSAVRIVTDVTARQWASVRMLSNFVVPVPSWVQIVSRLPRAVPSGRISRTRAVIWLPVHRRIPSGPAAPVWAQVGGRATTGVWIPVSILLRWSDGHPLPVGLWIQQDLPGEPYQPPPILDFRRPPGDGDLPFEKPRLLLIEQSMYLSTIDFSAKRLADDVAVGDWITTVTLETDIESWGWSLSGSVSGNGIDLLSPDTGPWELRLTAQGVDWDFLIESLKVKRALAERTAALSGRSLACWLAEPHAPRLTFVETQQKAAVQLVQDLLPNGWDLDWGLSLDWLVPAGAWSVSGVRPIDAMKRIAMAGGGVLISDRTGRRLAVQPHYPLLPWHWATAVPDVQAPLDYFEVLDTDNAVPPQYEAVFLAGQQGGIHRRVYRQGTAGLMMAPSEVNSLFTHSDATRGRGGVILGNGMIARTVTLRGMLEPPPSGIGLLVPRQLLRLVEGATEMTGMVLKTSLSLSATEATQTVQVAYAVS
jgi:hypothetical protein